MTNEVYSYERHIDEAQSALAKVLSDPQARVTTVEMPFSGRQNLRGGALVVKGELSHARLLRSAPTAFDVEEARVALDNAANWLVGLMVGAEVSQLRRLLVDVLVSVQRAIAVRDVLDLGVSWSLGAGDAGWVIQ